LFDANLSNFDKDVHEKRFLHFCPLTFRPQISSLVTFVQRYVSTKLEVSTAFVFWENRRHGTDKQTDGVQHLMPPP